MEDNIQITIMTVRITSSAIILSNSHPNKSVLVAESAMQNVGLSPLLFEVSLALLEWYALSLKVPITILQV